MSKAYTEQEQRLLNEAFGRISALRIFEEEGRFVILEKFHKPIITPPDIEHEEYEFFGLTIRGHGHTEIKWQNSSGKLHSFNGMPSLITFGTYSWLKVEWHKDGVPFRKKFLPNIIKAARDSYAYDNNKKEPISLEYGWLNEFGNYHSINDMPAKIDSNSIQWFWNGKNQRRSYGNGVELPCTITKFGTMTFVRHFEKDSPTTVNYPLSAKYYGKGTLYNLNIYERYVQWPIRKLLTL